MREEEEDDDDDSESDDNDNEDGEGESGNVRGLGLRLQLHNSRHEEMMRAVMQEEEDEEEAQLLELQRQSLIESLIGMGFPVDWALRAVEQCEVPSSQEDAMSWILERMTELEKGELYLYLLDFSQTVGFLYYVYGLLLCV